jgi:hypothetical protein
METSSLPEGSREKLASNTVGAADAGSQAAATTCKDKVQHNNERYVDKVCASWHRATAEKKISRAFCTQ